MPTPATAAVEPIVDEGLIRVETEVEEFIPRLEQLLEQGEAHEKVLRDQANAQRAENIRIRKIIRPFKDESPTPKKKTKGSGASVSDNRLDLLRAYFNKYKDREVTSKEIAKHFGWNTGLVSQALTILREREEVRLLGNRASPKGGRTKAYRLMD